LFTVLVLLVVSSAIYGYASSKSDMSLMGHMSLMGEHEVFVHYELNNKNPSQVSGVRLEIDSQGLEISVRSVVISLDNGETWYECKKSKNQYWFCEFQMGEMLYVKDVATLDIVVN
jgi:hypothetical protein